MSVPAAQAFGAFGALALGASVASWFGSLTPEDRDFEKGTPARIHRTITGQLAPQQLAEAPDAVAGDAIGSAAAN